MGDDWIPFAKRDKLSIPLMLAIGACSIAPVMIWSALMGLYFSLSFKIGIVGTLNTVILLIGAILGFFITPLIGVLSDGTTLKFGRRRIYMIVGTLALFAAYMMIIFCKDITKSPSGVKGVFIFGILLAYSAANVLQGPGRYIISDVCPPSQQVLMGSIAAIYSGIGGLFNNLLGALQLAKYTPLSQENFILICSIIVITITTIITCIVAKEEQLTEKPEVTNPFAGIFIAAREMTRPRLILCIISFVINIATYAFNLRINDFFGVIIYKGDPQAPKDSTKLKLYDQGVSFAMTCQCVNSAVQFVYSFFQTKVCDLLGLRITFALSMVFTSVMYVLFFFVKNKYVFLVMNLPFGIGGVGVMALPNIIMSLICPPEKLGANFSLINCFNVVGQQIANFGIMTGLNSLWPNKPGHLIGISCVPGFLAAVLCFFLQLPKPADISQDDEGVEDSESESDKPASI